MNLTRVLALATQDFIHWDCNLAHLDFLMNICLWIMPQRTTSLVTPLASHLGFFDGLEQTGLLVHYSSFSSWQVIFIQTKAIYSLLDQTTHAMNSQLKIQTLIDFSGLWLTSSSDLIVLVNHSIMPSSYSDRLVPFRWKWLGACLGWTLLQYTSSKDLMIYWILNWVTWYQGVTQVHISCPSTHLLQVHFSLNFCAFFCCFCAYIISCISRVLQPSSLWHTLHVDRFMLSKLH